MRPWGIVHTKCCRRRLKELERHSLSDIEQGRDTEQEPLRDTEIRNRLRMLEESTVFLEDVFDDTRKPTAK